MRPRVFMLMEHRNVDVSSASSFGQLIYLFANGESRPTFWDPAFIDEAIHRLWTREFDPAIDYFMVAGHMAPLVKLCCALTQVYPSTRGLFWDSIEARYVAQPLLILETVDDEPTVGQVVPGSASDARVARDGRRRTA